MSKNQYLPTRRQLIASFTSAAAVSAVMLAPTPALADKGAEQFVTKVANEAIVAARRGSAPAFRSLVRRNSALSSIASFALGKFRRKLPASKRKEYNRLVSRMVTNLFVQNARSFAGQSYVVKSSHARSSKDIVVKGRLLFAGGRDTRLEWRVTRSGSRYRVFDVRVKGVWLAIQLRQEIVSVLSKSGGDFDALFDYLKS